MQVYEKKRSDEGYLPKCFRVLHVGAPLDDFHHVFGYKGMKRSLTLLRRGDWQFQAFLNERNVNKFSGATIVIVTRFVRCPRAGKRTFNLHC